MFKGPYLNVKRFVLLKKDPDESYISLHTSGVWCYMHTHSCVHTDTYRLCGLDSHEAVVPFLPADVAKGSVVRDVLGNVGDLVDRMMMLEDLKRGTTQNV